MTQWEIQIISYLKENVNHKKVDKILVRETSAHQSINKWFLFVLCIQEKRNHEKADNTPLCQISRYVTMRNPNYTITEEKRKPWKSRHDTCAWNKWISRNNCFLYIVCMQEKGKPWKGRQDTLAWNK